MNRVSDIIPEDEPSRRGPVERYATLAALIADTPGLDALLLDVGQKVAVARKMGWVGKIEINVQAGQVSGGPQLKVV